MDALLSMFVFAAAVGLGATLALEIVIYKSMDRMREEIRSKLHPAAGPTNLTGIATSVPIEGRAHGFSLPSRPTVKEQAETAERKKTVSLSKPRTLAQAKKAKEEREGPAIANVDVTDVSMKIKRDDQKIVENGHGGV